MLMRGAEVDAVQAPVLAPGASSVPAVTRASAILSALAAAQGVPVSVSELARRLGLPKSSTANICLSLEAERMVARHDDGYVLGRRLAELGGAYLSTFDQVKEFYRACRVQPNISRYTARAAVLEGLDVLYLARYEGTPAIRLTANIGNRFPAHCTATGKVLLAQTDLTLLQERLRNVDRLVALTDRSITDPTVLMAELRRVRDAGYAMDNEEVTPGVTCLAITVGDAIAAAEPFAISVTLLSTALTDSLKTVLLSELHAVAVELQNPMLPGNLHI
jgi:DNA-binding IclR family transcriptional regulator